MTWLNSTIFSFSTKDGKRFHGGRPESCGNSELWQLGEEFFICNSVELLKTRDFWKLPRKICFKNRIEVGQTTLRSPKNSSSCKLHFYPHENNAIKQCENQFVHENLHMMTHKAESSQTTTQNFFLISFFYLFFRPSILDQLTWVL